MNRVTSFVSLSLALLGSSGCAIESYRTADLSQHPELVHLEVKSLQDVYTLFDGVKIVVHPETKTFDWDARAVRWAGIESIEFEGTKTFSMDYHRSLLYRAPNVHIPVEFPGGRKYIAYLDTGFPVHIVLTSDIVLANKLPIYLFEGHTLQGACRIAELKVGPARIKDVVGTYLEQQWQFRILNMPVYKHPVVLLGLPFMASFDYLLFDNVGQKVVFSKDGAFEPDGAEQWTSYPFEIKPDANDNDRIMVQMPVAGQAFELFFDSCGDEPGLRLNRTRWESLKQCIHVRKSRRAHYYNYQKGRLPCEIATVSELSVGEKALTDVAVRIVDDSKGLSMISLGYFQDTVVVLDFVNKRLWIRA